MKTSNKILYILLGVILIFLTIHTVYHAILQLYPYPLIEIASIEELNGGIYSRGDEITFGVTYKKERNYPSETLRRIECWDGNLVTLTSFTVSLPLTEGKKFGYATSQPMVIPDKVSDGECWFVFTEHTHVNEDRTEITEERSESFKVLPREVL